MKLYFTLLNIIFTFSILTSYAQESIEGEVPANDNLNNPIQQPIQEFFLSETVYPQEKFEVQLTPSVYYWKHTAFELTDFSCLLEFGFTDRFMIEAEIPYSLYNYAVIPEPEGTNENGFEKQYRGVGDVEIGLLYNLYLQKDFSLSCSMGVGLPLGDEDKGLGEGQVEWESGLTIARQFGKAQAHINIGAALTKAETEWNYNLATLYTFGQVTTTLELNGAYDEEQKLYVTPGVVWTQNKFLQYGIGTPIGVVGETAKWGMILRLNFEFGLLEDNDE